jgi:hypothetical protein
MGITFLVHMEERMTAGSVVTSPDWIDKATWEASRSQREAAAREWAKQLTAMKQDMLKGLPKGLQQELAKLAAASKAADQALAQTKQELEAHLAHPPEDTAQIREYAVRKIELETTLPILQTRAAAARKAKEDVMQKVHYHVRGERERRVVALDAEIDRIQQEAERAVVEARKRYALIEEAAGQLATYEGD